ncbi:MAG: DUF6017 domain-containing protein [Oscillospiraceae bacterium]
MNSIYQLLNPDNTISLNRPLAHAIGIMETITYGALVAKWYYYSERNMLDEDGWFYSTVPDLEESTALSEYQQKRCINSLTKLGLLKSKSKGMPAKRSFYIIDDVQLLEKYLQQGEEHIKDIKPAAADSYIRKRQPNSEISCSEETAEQAPKETGSLLLRNSGASSEETKELVPDGSNTLLPRNCGASTEETAELAPDREYSLLLRNYGASSEETAEHAPNKLGSMLPRNCGSCSEKLTSPYYIKSKDNNPNIINLSINPQKDKNDGQDFISRIMEDRSCYTQIIRDNTDYDILIEQNPDKADEINELMSIMVDVVCSTKPTIRVNGEDIPHKIVKSTFLKLNSSHIEYILTAMSKNTSDVRNIRSYLITALYNAPATMNSFWGALVNHDMAGS